MGTVKSFLILSLTTLVTLGADWYVRPGIFSNENGGGCVPVPQAGVYGSQNGTSYANAWNGLRAVVWGASGVQAGDTLWVCGAHVLRQSNTTCFGLGDTPITSSGTSGSPITIRMDYESDPGEVFGLWQDRRVDVPWQGPDANGVYYMNEAGAATTVYPIFLETDGVPTVGCTVYILTNKSPDTTWVSGSGATYVDTGTLTTNYVKPNFLVGGTISTNVFGDNFGYRFTLGQSSNITFQSCRFTASVPRADILTDGEWSANHITFTNCSFRCSVWFPIYPGWDDWTFDGCTFSTMGNGIYTQLISKPAGAHRLTVKNCTFSDIGYGRTDATSDGRFLHNDSHSVGIQGGNGHLIERNTMQRTGTAVEFWTANQQMTNGIVRYNFIKDVVICPVTAGHGINISGDNTHAVVGTRTGFQVYGNIILNTGLNGVEDYQGAGISANNKDPMEVFNNTISNSNSGFRLEVVGGQPATGVFQNNIIINPRWMNLRVTGTGTTTLTSDYNLFYPSPNSSDKVSLSPSFTHDANSVFGQDPLFTGGTDANYYRLQSTSPARGAGTAISGYTVDRAGHVVSNPPSIGAFEYFGAKNVSTTFRAVNLIGR